MNPVTKQALYGSKPVSAVGPLTPHYTQVLSQKLSIKRDGKIAIRKRRVANCATYPTPRFQTTATTELNTPRHQNITNEAITTQIAANVTTLTSTFSKSELAMYHHQSLGNPRKETLLKGLR